VARTLAKLLEIADKGVIFGVTGNKDPVQINNFISQGANQIFSKPLDLDKLRDAIDLKVV
jgi:hypothetical protein